MRRPSRDSTPASRAQRQRFELANEDLLEFEAQHGMRGLCHLLIFVAGESQPVCVVGNFENHVGPATGSVIESVATSVADRLGRQQFRLIEWYPHWPQSHHTFAEVILTPVPETAIPAGQLATTDDHDVAPLAQRTALVRYVDPQWNQLSEDDLAALLGEPAIRELRSYAGLPGDYTPQRLFGTTGITRLDAIRQHNQRTAENLKAQLDEWAYPPKQ